MPRRRPARMQRRRDPFISNLERAGLLPALRRDGGGENRRFWGDVDSGMQSDHQASALFDGDNVLVINDGVYGSLCFDHVLVCAVEPDGRAFLHASNDAVVSPPVQIAAEDVQVFINLFHVGVVSPAQFFKPPRDDPELMKDPGEQRANRSADLLCPAVLDGGVEYNKEFFDDHRPFFLSKGVFPLMRGGNVLVLTDQRGFRHTLVLTVGVCDRLLLYGSDGSAVDPALEVDAGDLAYFILHYHGRADVSPERFFRMCLGAGEVELEDNPASSPPGTRNPRRPAGQGAGEANPDAVIDWMQYRNPRRRRSLLRDAEPQRTPGETPRWTEGSRGNPHGRRGSSDDSGNPGTRACMALERAVDCLRW